MHIPQATNAPGDVCQGLHKCLFRETAPLPHHAGPSESKRGWGWSRMHRAPEGTGREEDEGLEVAGWVLRWSCMTKEGWEDLTPLWAMQSLHTLRETRVGLLAGVSRKAGFYSRILQIRHPGSAFPHDYQSTSRPGASPLLSLLQNKRSVQGMPKCNWIKMYKKPSSFPLLLLGCPKGHAQHAKKNLLTSHSAGKGDLKPTKIIVTVFSQSQ